MNRTRDFVTGASIIGYPIIALITGAFVVKHYGPMDCTITGHTPTWDCVGAPPFFDGLLWPIFWVWNLAQWWLP